MRTIRRIGEAVPRPFQGEVVLVPVSGQVARTSSVIKSNPSGQMLWERISKQEITKRDDLLQLILETYDVEAEIAERDLDDFLENLREIGLVELCA